MAVHLLADVHLRDADDPNAARLAAYLNGQARDADVLYVLGDLFDVWIGDDGSMPLHRPILEAFNDLARSGVSLFFMRGNRDFAVGEAFVAASQLQILDDPSVVELGGTPTLLSHGDMLCTDDVSHQAFRRRYTDPRWRARMMKLPLWLRRGIARRARKKSAAGKQRKPACIMDVNAQAVRQMMQRYRVKRLIHGHTHRPNDHVVALDGQNGERVVIADWQDHQAEILVVDESGVSRRSLIG